MLVALYAATAVDGFFPPVPSESVVIALAALPAAAGRPSMWLLGVVAALGAFTGDQVAYSIGRRIPIRRLRVLRSERAQSVMTWAEGALRDRSAAFIIGARFVPGGRVAVNTAAGAMHFSRPLFSALAAVAAVLWSAYSLFLGVGARHLLEHHHPLLVVAGGVCGGLLTGVVVDRVLQRLMRPSRTCRARGRHAISRRLGRPVVPAPHDERRR